MHRFRMWILPLAAALSVWMIPAQAADDNKERLVPEEGAIQVMLLRQKSVRAELQLTEDECQKIDTFTSEQWKKAKALDNVSAEERRTKFEEMSKDNEKFLNQVLEPAQRKRLDEITLQVAGLMWLSRPNVCGILHLTDDQKEQVKRHQKEARKEIEEVIHATSHEKRADKLRELRAMNRKRIMNILNDDQELMWKQMSGEPFVGVIIIEPTRYEPLQ